MGILDPESLMFSLPAEEIKSAFIKAANDAGYFGLDVYKFSWDLGKCELTEEQKKIFKLAEEMGHEAGKQISDLYAKSLVN